MNLSTADLQLESLDALQGVDTLLLFVGEDERPLLGAAGLADWRLCGALSRMLVSRFFTGAKADSVLLPADGRLPVERILVLGVGRRKELNPAGVGELLQAAAGRLNKLRSQGVAMDVPGAGLLDDEALARTVTGVFMPAFQGGQLTLLAGRGLAKAVGR